MRKTLAKLGDQKRYSFMGQFARVGYRKYHDHCLPTILFTQVTLVETGEIICDHFWFNYTNGFLALGELLAGDWVTFDGRLGFYVRGNQTLDCKIQWPTKVRFLSKVSGPRQPMPRGQTKFEKQALIGYIMHRQYDFYIANQRPIEPFFLNQYRRWIRRNQKNARKTS